MENIQCNITGLSTSKVTHHLLQNKIQCLITKIWKLHSETNKSLTDHQLNLINSLNELFPLLQTISWSHSNTIQALRSLPLLLIDLLKISFLYFSYSPIELLSTYSPVIIELMFSQSIQLLEEIRLEKHCDLIIDDLPSCLLIVQRSFDLFPNYEVSAKLSTLLIPYMNLIQIHAVSYTNRKKLFLAGTTILLKPLLSFSAHLLQAMKLDSSSSSSSSSSSLVPSSWKELLLKSVDDVLTKIFFDEIHHIEELTQIPLTTFIHFEKKSKGKEIHDLPLTLPDEQNKKRKSEENGDGESGAVAGDKKQKLASGKASKPLILTYHMSFYSSITEWVTTQSVGREGRETESEDALEHLLHLYFHASKEIANITERTISFVQKWRLHIKRVLHLGLGLIYAICGDGICSEIPLLRFRNAILHCLNQGVSGNSETLSTTRQIGAIPDHDSLNIYVQRLRDLSDGYLTRSLELSLQLREGKVLEMGKEEVDYVHGLVVDVTFLRTAIALDCRMVTDTSLPLTFRILGNIFASSGHRSEVDLHLTSEALELFLQLLELYADLRR
jgi:hypothetical protein